MSHYKKVCKYCNIIIAQCRCISRDKKIIKIVCVKCSNNKGQLDRKELLNGKLD